MSTQRSALAVVSGGLSAESTTHRLADALTHEVRIAAEDAGLAVDVTRIDVRDHAQAIASASLTGYATGDLAAAYDAVVSADALIAVSPTYKASYTGLFKAFWDVTPDGALRGVPTLIGSTGGTPRHALVNDTAMRPLFASMRALVLPTAIYTAAEDWGGSQLQRRVRRAAGELLTQLELRDMRSRDDTSTDMPSGEETRARHRASDPFAGVPTMEQMLRR